MNVEYFQILKELRLDTQKIKFMVFVESNNFTMGLQNGDWQGFVNAIGKLIKQHDDKSKALCSQTAKKIEGFSKDL